MEAAVSGDCMGARTHAGAGSRLAAITPPWHVGGGTSRRIPCARASIFLPPSCSILTALLLGLTSSVAVAQASAADRGAARADDHRWLLILEAVDRVVHADAWTVRSLPNGHMEAWMRTRFSEIREPGTPHAYASAMALREYNCEGRQLKTLRTIVYDAAGQPVDSIGGAETAKWEPVGPATTPRFFTTPAEFELHIMCNPAVREVLGRR
jgi:hypothetical protein